MNSVDVKPNIFIDSSKEINHKDPKFRTDRISKYKKNFAKGMFQIGLKKIMWLKKFNILCHGHMLLMILTEKKLLERFTKKNCRKKKEKKT